MLSRVYAVRVNRGQEGAEFLDQVIVEHSLKLNVNGAFCHQFSCLPEHFHELVLGYLITAGRIQRINQLAAAYFANNNQLCLASVDSSSPTELTRLKNHSFDIDWVWKLVDAFESHVFPLHLDTGALHTALIAMNGRVICEAHDIGRHNALDKAIGMALKLGADPHQCQAFISGRVPEDMVEKVIHAGIPVLVARKAPTSKAIQLADKYNLSLVCYARADKCNLYKKGVADE